MVVDEERSKCEILMDVRQLKHVSEVEYLCYMLDENGADDA